MFIVCKHRPTQQRKRPRNKKTRRKKPAPRTNKRNVYCNVPAFGHPHTDHTQNRRASMKHRQCHLRIRIYYKRASEPASAAAKKESITFIFVMQSNSPSFTCVFNCGRHRSREPSARQSGIGIASENGTMTVSSVYTILPLDRYKRRDSRAVKEIHSSVFSVRKAFVTNGINTHHHHRRRRRRRCRSTAASQQ